jgi:hypothetical protein
MHFAITGGARLQEWPRSPTLTWTAALAALGLVALTGCAIAVYRRVGPNDTRRVLVTAVIIHACMLFSLPLFSTDLFTYLAYGELAARGLDMQVYGPARLGDSPLVALANWPNQPSVYGPFASALMSMAGHVGKWAGSPLWAAGVCYKLLTGAFDIGSLFLMHAVTRRADDAAARGFTVFALNPLLAWHVAAEGHNDGLIVFFTCVYLWALTRNRESLGVVALCLGILSKFVLAPVLVLHLWASVRTNVKRTVFLVLLCLGVAAVFYAPTWSGPATIATWLRPFRQASTFQHGTSLYSLIAKIWSVLHVGEGVEHASYYAYVWTGRVIVLALFASLLVRVKALRDVPLASLILLVGILSTNVILAPWYLTWLVPFAAVQTDRRWQGVALAAAVAGAPSHGVQGLWPILAVLQVAGVLFILRVGFRGSLETPALLAESATS